MWKKTKIDRKTNSLKYNIDKIWKKSYVVYNKEKKGGIWDENNQNTGTWKGRNH